MMRAFYHSRENIKLQIQEAPVELESLYSTLEIKIANNLTNINTNSDTTYVHILGHSKGQITYNLKAFQYSW